MVNFLTTINKIEKSNKNSLVKRKWQKKMRKTIKLIDIVLKNVGHEN